ncbi:MAG: ATP-binding protein, partial [Gemmatimonadota bacterium]
NAHYLVDLSGPLALTARATLLLVLNLGIMLLVWASVRAILLGGRPGPADIRPLLGSFRARVTLALFAFFLLSNAIFGTLAYRTISGAAERAARVLAERVVRDGAAIYNQVGGQMELLARQVGADLLEFRDGELLEGSSEELVELGLFEGWLPWDVDQLLTARQDVMATREERLGRWEYVTAFRRLPDGDILAAPVPLQAGATAVRREEVAHLLGFAVVAGALLSLVLALLVGRTLARPIRTLQVASERVGAGNLGVRLPGDRSDEFGAVFGAFNRMVRRLRRARRALVRTTRRTEAIVEDAATGVIALDSSGRTTLANPRAGELLGRSVAVGERLREDGTPADEFVRWVKLYFRDGLRELGGEFQFGERRVRVRARRIEREGSQGGAVVSLEDVTDELRTERVLAWGEMARQVAHEVKNPLTPIKLAIQHIRRAWDDRRPDFDEILTRNADAALGEIDRLATIASSFSRFGAPEAAGAAPLGPVRLHAVVGEVMALYQSGEGGVRFDTAVSADLPAVRARATEMKEVLVNLLENSRAAIEDEGVVRVRAVEAGDTVVLDVQDDGGGISTDLLPRVFEPHFSTRSAGTGLGLAIVKRLVESWEATVAVESEPGQGTVVRIYLEAWRDGDRPGPREGASRGGV